MIHTKKKNILIAVVSMFAVLYGMLLFPTTAHAQAAPQAAQLYRANPRQYNWRVGATNYTNNRNPFGIEVYLCQDANGDITYGGVHPGGKDRQDLCIPTAVNQGGNKWWTGVCVTSQAQYDGPIQSQDTRRPNGSRNADIQVCSDTYPIRGAVPFLKASAPFTFYSSMCTNGNAVLLASRPDVSNPECTSVTPDQVIDNPRNYTQSQRECLLYIDNEADITACRNGQCSNTTYTSPLITGNTGRPLPTSGHDLCSIFNHGDGAYTVTLDAYDLGPPVYGSSSLYVTWLYNAISGNVFIDDNKNGLKDAGESNYLGSSSFTIDGSNTTISPNGSYIYRNVVPGLSHTISFTSLPSGYFLTRPLTGPPPTYLVTVGTNCSTNGAPGAVCGAGDITNLNFAIVKATPWIQINDLDVRLDNGFKNEIPPTSLYPAYALAQTNNANSPGVLFLGNGTANFGSGRASATNWIAGGGVYPEVFNNTSGSLSKVSYTAMLAKAQQAKVAITNMTSIPSCFNLANCTLPGGLAGGVYLANGDVGLNGYTFPAGSKYVFLINGNLTVNGNIIVPNGSSATFAVKRDITIDRNIGTAPAFPRPAGQVQGNFSAEGNFLIAGINDCVVGADKMLNMEGSIIANAGDTGSKFSYQRDLCGGNTQYPTFTLIPRLDFIFSAPAFIKTQQTFSHEVAP